MVPIKKVVAWPEGQAFCVLEDIFIVYLCKHRKCGAVVLIGETYGRFTQNTFNDKE